MKKLNILCLVFVMIFMAMVLIICEAQNHINPILAPAVTKCFLVNTPSIVRVLYDATGVISVSITHAVEVACNITIMP